MGEKGLSWALGISVAIHVFALAIIGHGSARNLSVSSVSYSPRFINVDLVDLENNNKPQPVKAPKLSLPFHKPVTSVGATAEASTLGVRSNSGIANSQAPRVMARSGPGAGKQMVTGGGGLNIGSTSSAGDLPGNWGGGKTPVGWVPDPEEGPGQGSGHGPGTGSPEPVRREEKTTGPQNSPAPAPNPPQPATVNVRVCSHSGLLPGPYCRETQVRTFVEGRQPSRTCDSCQPPHTSRLADRAEPQLVRDSQVSIPSSIPEGLTLRVEIQYTVTADGDVTDITVVRSSGYKALDNAIVSAASRMKYKPAVQDGIPRSVKRVRTYTVNT